MTLTQNELTQLVSLLEEGYAVLLTDIVLVFTEIKLCASRWL